MARKILIDPAGGPVEAAGEILEPGAAPLRIDLWRRVRHPPPELAHVRSVKDLRATRKLYYAVGDPSELLGKVLSWVWVCSHLQDRGEHWRVRVDVRQNSASLPGFPVEYGGPLPPGRELAELRVSEPIGAR